MATQFSIDDAFVLDGDEEEAVSDGDTEGWKSKDKDREGAEMTFGPLTFSKPQTHPSPAAAPGSPEHSNLKYQVQIFFFLNNYLFHQKGSTEIQYIFCQGVRIKRGSRTKRFL